MTGLDFNDESDFATRSRIISVVKQKAYGEITMAKARFLECQ